MHNYSLRVSILLNRSKVNGSFITIIADLQFFAIYRNRFLEITKSITGNTVRAGCRNRTVQGPLRCIVVVNGNAVDQKVGLLPPRNNVSRLET